MKTEKRNDFVRRGLLGMFAASLTALVALSACSKDPVSELPPSTDGAEYLMLAPDFVGVNDAPQTMGLIDPNFTGKMVFDMGLFICDNNSAYPSSIYHPHAAGYFNMKGHCEANRVSSGDPATYTWTYTPSNTTVSYTGAGIRVTSGAKVDVYAYTPYTTGSISDPRHIPYVASQNDYMWADPVMNVSSGTVSLPLKHAMTCFSFKIYTTKVGNATLKQIKVSDKSGSHIVASGMFDATTGEVNDRIYASSAAPVYVDINAKVPLGTADEATFDVIVPPITDYKDEHIEISLIFSDYNAAGTEFLTPVAIPALSASFEDGKYQFKRGYRYIYQIEVDNYNKFTPLGFEEWGLSPDQTVDVEI